MTKSDLLVTLYNSSYPCGMGFLQSDDKLMTIEQADELLKNQDYFDYLKGKAMKLSFSNFPIIDFERFDSRNGKGAFMECINKIAK